MLAIVDNLIKGTGEKSKNPLGLAKAYHRMKVFVLTHFEEYLDDGKFKLRKKEQPEPPTLEQLAPARRAGHCLNGLATRRWRPPRRRARSFTTNRART